MSVMVPIHDKPVEVIMRVIRALRGQGIAEGILVMDRASREVLGATSEATGIVKADDDPLPFLDARFVYLEGRPGWRSPCIAANAGLAKITGDITIYNPSDVVQRAGNIEVVRAHFAEHPKSVLFGRVTESNPDLAKGQAHAGPVLQGSDNPRPMTFLTAYPTEALKAIGGWDELFQEGVCYEDDDLAARLWKHGLDFVFDDCFVGVHQSHERVFDGNNASQGYWTDYRVGLNRSHMVRKHGRDSARNVVMQDKPKIVTGDGRVEWLHAR